MIKSFKNKTILLNATKWYTMRSEFTLLQTIQFKITNGRY
jgi:hypothetical protein